MEKHSAVTFIALMIKATPPQADGEDIDVPFISIRRCRVHVGTGATAPPGALTETPMSPSTVGPRLDLHFFQLITIIQTQRLFPSRNKPTASIMACTSAFKYSLYTITEPTKYIQALWKEVQLKHELRPP